MFQSTVSVIIPNYNHSNYIGRALEAFLNQSVRPLEVLVVDDGSTDDSISVIEKFVRRDPIVKLIRNDRNRGTIFSFNRALNMASGNYICGAAADDMVLPGFFEKSLHMLALYPQAGLSCSDPSFLDISTNQINEAKLYITDRPTYYSPTELIKKMLRHPFPIAGHTSLIKRSAFLEAGGFKDELRWHCDWFTLLVIAFRYGICYVPGPLALIQVNPSSYSGAGMRNWLYERVILNHMIRLLNLSIYRDVLPTFKQSGVFATFRTRILRTIMFKPKYWDFFPALLQIWNLWMKVGVLKISEEFTIMLQDSKCVKPRIN